MSQFLYKDVPWGAQTLHQTHRILTQKDYLTEYEEWLRIQNGVNPMKEDELEHPDNPTHIRSYLHLQTFAIMFI